MSDVGFLRGFFLGAIVFLAGCSSAPAGDDEGIGTAEGELGEAAVLRFDGDFAERLTGDLTKGKKVRVVYDPARLTQCRGEQGGSPQWSISGAYRIGGGPVKTFGVAGLSGAGPEGATLELDRSGELEMWFSNNNRWGCNAYDSDFGRNYRFQVKPAAHEPGWVGNARYAIERMTCDGKACDSSLRPVPAELLYESWARQRAAVRVLTFEVWKEGVTDRENPDLWRQLDVQVHTRVRATRDTSAPFESRYVRFDARTGNNARYAIDLTELDPIPGHVLADAPEKCPAAPLEIAPNDDVDAVVELYVTVNGVELRPSPEGFFRVRYRNHGERFPACPKT